MAVKCEHTLDKATGKYEMKLSDLNNTQLMAVYRTVEKFDWDENLTERFGTIIHLPVGEMAGRNLEDAAAEFGLTKVVGILKSLYMLGSQKAAGMNPYFATGLYNELLMWMSLIIEGIPTCQLLDAFYDFIPDADAIKKRIVSVEGRDDGWSLELERGRIRSAIDKIYIRVIPALAEDRAILTGHYVIPNGKNEGMTFRQVYEEKSLYELVQQMLTAEKGSLLFDKCKEHIACLLKYAENLIPYEDFVSAFEKFFRLNEEQVVDLIQQSETDKALDYKAKLAELTRRISG